MCYNQQFAALATVYQKEYLFPIGFNTELVPAVSISLLFTVCLNYSLIK